MAGFFGIGARSGPAEGPGGAEREGRDGGVARGLRRVPGVSSGWRLGYAREEKTAKQEMGFQSVLCLYWVIGPVLKFLELGLKN
jgi:hypothetical protein